MTAADTPDASGVLDDRIVPRLAHGRRLQWEAAQNAHVVLYPDGMVQLNQSAGEILKRCDGQRPLSAIVADLEQAFSHPGLKPEVDAFLLGAKRQGWVTWGEVAA